MIDKEMRAALAPLVDHAARRLARQGVTPLAVTILGLAIALAAAVAAALAMWWLALGLWLLSRIPDGIDGALARVRGGGTPLGGWADISADLAAYGTFVVGCAIGNPDAQIACVVLLFTYYLNGGSLLALSAAASERRIDRPDERTFHFPRSLAEGTETIVAHSLMVLVPAWMPVIAWTFSALVLATILQRTLSAIRILR
ncbi:MAG: CDP-alcohol phosphatidyltransferase family protein [Nitriliruptoraceae bacterium]